MPPSGSAALFLCKTKHTRFSPVSNTFQYSYLVLGLPISLDGHTQNPFIDYNIFLQFFSLRERDYLLRTLEPLHEKLDHYLEEEVRDDCQMSNRHQYLVSLTFLVEPKLKRLFESFPRNSPEVSRPCL